VPVYFLCPVLFVPYVGLGNTPVCECIIYIKIRLICI